jgi:hypothetical protein
MATGPPLTGGTKKISSAPHRDEVPPFRRELKVIGFGDVTEMPAS